MQSKLWAATRCACALVAAALLGPHIAQAVTLTPGTWTALPGTSLQADPSLSGTVLADVTSSFAFQLYDFSPFNPPTPVGAMSGSVQSRVVKEDATGTLDF